MVEPFEQPIFVTRPLLPDLQIVTAKLQEIWAAQWLSNGGMQHQKLECALRDRLRVPNLTLFNNGTTALMAAVQTLGLAGEVITTPFTFVATTHALALNGLTPVFCDIDPSTMNIDPDQIESLITPKTSAIMPVHVYGMPCDVEQINEIARKHGLKVIYDAAHAFDSEVGGAGIGAYGDITMYSFHATKTFHTVEGGALAFGDAALKPRLERLKNFGIRDEERVDAVGFNGKLNELQAAVGLAVLDCLDGELTKRRALVDVYRAAFDGVPGLTLPPLSEHSRTTPSYFVIRIEKELFGSTRDDVYRHLQGYNVFARKYFYPLCSDFAPYRHLPSAAPQRLPVASRIARQVLALPLYGALSAREVERICELVLATPLRFSRGTERSLPAVFVSL